MTDPTPNPVPATLTGWQYVVLQIAVLAAGVLTLFIQSHYQHTEAVAISSRQHGERIKALQAIEHKLPTRVFGGEPEPVSPPVEPIKMDYDLWYLLFIVFAVALVPIFGPGVVRKIRGK